MVKLTIKVIIAVFKNYAMPNFLATLILNSVYVECFSICANFRITKPNTMLIVDISNEATNPNIVIATAVVYEVVVPVFDKFM